MCQCSMNNMHENFPTEERYPLLLLLLEDGQHPSKHTRGMFFDKGRHYGITSGVTTVITQWPGHVATCLTTAIFIGITIILLSTLTLMVTVTPQASLLTTRCKNHVYSHNATTTTVHLVHGLQSWTQSQLDVLEQIAKRYGESNVDLIAIQNEVEVGIVTTENVTKSPPVSRNVSLPPFQFDINIGAKNFLRMFIAQKNRNKRQQKSTVTPTTTPNHFRNLNDLLLEYPAITVINATYTDIFKQSPLFFTWHELDENTRLFAVRVMQIWNHAGITFDLPEESKNDTDENYRSLIDSGMQFFERLPLGLVTVDENGFHMETKTVCHAFFGEILTKLRNAKGGVSPTGLIAETLREFCRRGAVDVNYCKKLVK